MRKVQCDCAVESQHPNDGFNNRNVFVPRLLWGKYFDGCPGMVLCNRWGDLFSAFPHRIAKSFSIISAFKVPCSFTGSTAVPQE